MLILIKTTATAWIVLIAISVIVRASAITPPKQVEIVLGLAVLVTVIMSFLIPIVGIWFYL